MQKKVSQKIIGAGGDVAACAAAADPLVVACDGAAGRTTGSRSMAREPTKVPAHLLPLLVHLPVLLQLHW